MADQLKARQANISGVGAMEVALEGKVPTDNLPAIDPELKKIDGTVLGALKFVKCTQAEYDALATKDANTMYIIAA